MRAVSRAADNTLLVLEIDAEFDEGRQQSRRLHPDDNENGEGGGDKGPLAEPPTAPFTIRTLPFVDDWLHSNDAEGEVMMFTRMMGKESISWWP